MLFLKTLSILFVYLFSFEILSMPIDWGGELSVESNLLQNVRRSKDECTPVAGSMCIAKDEQNARNQNMIFKLSPSIIVNDGVTIKGELATGSGRTSRLGDSTTIDSSSGAYFAQTTSSTLNINQIYAEIYADTALYRVGRYSKHFGLGALINSGETSNSHYFSGYEGVEASLKLGNFNLTPSWTKLHTSNNPNGKYDAYEMSVLALYDNSNKNLKFGVYYGVREVETQSSLYGANNGPHNITLIDIYVQKEWDKISLGLEVPMVSGEVGDFYDTGDDASLDANAYVLESTYTLNPNWKLNINGGYVKGDDGTTDSFEGMYLHPNYKKGKVLYYHNLRAFNDSAYDINNAAISNSTYAHLEAEYMSSEWSWRISALWAKANAVASSGDDFYDHEQTVLVSSANEDQSDDLGYEVTTEFDYRWNPSVVFSGYLGYYFVGDYYTFTNSSDELSVDNVISTGFSLSINF